MLELSDALKVQPEQLPDRVNKLVAQLKEAEKRIADLRSQTVLSDVGSIVAKSHDMWGVGYIAHRADGVSGNDLRSLAFEIRNRVQDTASVVALVGGPVDKPSVVIVTTQGARDRGLDAGELVRVASETLGGRGGGKPTSPKAAAPTAVAPEMPSRPWSTPSGTRCSPSGRAVFCPSARARRRAGETRGELADRRTCEPQVSSILGFRLPAAEPFAFASVARPEQRVRWLVTAAPCPCRHGVKAHAA